jgi:GTP cyclohydrolase II
MQPNLTRLPLGEGSGVHGDGGPRPGDFSNTSAGNRVEIYARARLPTRHGEFTIFAFRNDKDRLDHVALVKGDVWGRTCVPLRLHSECLTGDVFGSLKCDCREQLDLAKDSVAAMPYGMILYMRQEGRGIGLANKIRAYSLQDCGMDTVEANLHLGFDDDMREYDIAAEIVKLLGPISVELMTNNPTKVLGLSSHGVLVASRSSIEVAPNKHNVFYLNTKRRKSGHLLHE